MQRIFNDERGGSRSKAPDPSRTGLFSTRASSRMAAVEPTTVRHPLLTLVEKSSRHDRNLILNRP